MPQFHYQAIDKSGAEVSGVVEARDSVAADDKLKKHGLFVTRLTERADRSPRESDGDAPPSSPRPSINLMGRPTMWPGYVFGGLFLAIGLIFLYALAVRPQWQMAQAKSWVETPCTIVSSELDRHASTSGSTRRHSSPTYRLVIVYDYDFGGKAYRCERYNFVTGSSNTNIDHRHAIVRDHPPGKRTFCYVNPRSPSEAVLNRDWDPEMWWGIFPIPFVLVGVVALAIQLRRAMTSV